MQTLSELILIDLICFLLTQMPRQTMYSEHHRESQAHVNVQRRTERKQNSLKILRK